MSVRVRDLEIALVLAREMKAAAERSVDASLRLEQLQEVFGAPQLDQAERARIQTALQMAGLEPQPSLLEADPADAIRFATAAKAPAAAAAGGAGPPPVPPPAPAEPAAAEPPPPTFPTVGQFARSKFGRSRRARRAARDDHGGAPARPAPEELPADVTREYEEQFEAEPEVPDAGTEAEAEFEAEAEMPAAEAEAAAAEADRPAAEPDPAEADADLAGAEPDRAEAEAQAAEPERPEIVEPESAESAQPESGESANEPEPVVAAQPQPAAEPAYEPQPEQLPYPPPPLADEPPAPEPARAGASVDEVVAALLPAVAIPVIVTSIAGWRFGLPFVALSVIATGWLLGRGESKRGLLATLRESPAAATVLKATAIVTVLGVVASLVLNSAGKSSTTRTAAPAKKPAQPAAAARPSPAPAKPKHRPHKQQTPKGSTQAQAKPPTGPPPDPHTAGLVRVPPKRTATPGSQTGTGAGTGTGTQTGTGAQPRP